MSAEAEDIGHPGISLPILLVSPVLEANRHRWYSLHLQHALFGGLSLVCQWGRQGRGLSINGTENYHY